MKSWFKGWVDHFKMRRQRVVDEKWRHQIRDELSRMSPEGIINNIGKNLIKYNEGQAMRYHEIWLSVTLGDNWREKGVCHIIQTRHIIPTKYLFKFNRTWDRYSGQPHFPVKCPDGGSPELAFTSCRDKWVGAYGEERLAYLTHVLKCFSQMVYMPKAELP